MDQSLVRTFSSGDSYGPMVLKILLKSPPTLVLVHGWLFQSRLVYMQSQKKIPPTPEKGVSSQKMFDSKRPFLG